MSTQQDSKKTLISGKQYNEKLVDSYVLER